MPWAIENAGFHGRGNLILFPNGRVVDFDQFYFEETGSKWDVQIP